MARPLIKEVILHLMEANEEAEKLSAEIFVWDIAQSTEMVSIPWHSVSGHAGAEAAAGRAAAIKEEGCSAQ